MDRRNILGWLLSFSWLSSLIRSQSPTHVCGQGCIHELEERVTELEVERNRLIRERDNWEDSARFHAKNEAFYRDLIYQTGVSLGPEAYVSDDGSVQDTPLALKVPELTRKLVAERDAYRDRLRVRVRQIS